MSKCEYLGCDSFNLMVPVFVNLCCALTKWINYSCLLTRKLIPCTLVSEVFASSISW